MAKRIFLVLGVLVVIFGGIPGLKYLQIQGMIKQFSQPRPPATVASVQVGAEQWRPRLQAVGSLVAVNGVEVSSEVDGVVHTIHFRSGEQVQEGEPLLRLDDTVDRAALEALRAAAHLSRVQFKRASDLLPKKAVSQSTYDEAKATYDADLAKVEEQRSRVARKTIRAPFTGQLGIRRVDLGEFLKAGVPIVRLEALDPMYVDYSLPERFLPRLVVGQEVQVRVDALPGETFNGKIAALESGINEGTRSIMVRAELANPEGRLRPGMFADVLTLQDDMKEVLTVPRTAVSYNTYGNFVYVMEATDKEGQWTVQRRQVNTGEIRAGRVVVEQGLGAGDTVVRAGLVKLRDGMTVQVDNSVQLDDAGVSHE
jgi:membrane fusion protein (multidrug efflux system)